MVREDFKIVKRSLLTEKENLFSKFLHVPSALIYKKYPPETFLNKESTSDIKDLSKKSELDKMATQRVTQVEPEKNSLSFEKVSTTKKVLCNNNLDETLDDFQESQIEKRQKLMKKQENPIFACFVCQTDIAHLDLNERAIHINQCIDSQPSAAISSEEAAAESTFILDCPLCFKHFPTSETRCAHIKKCGKSRGLSTQSVIQALRLQEKHVLERRALGLPLNNKPTKQSKKPAAKKFLIKPKSSMESDIHLAKALSLSLKENENKVQNIFDLAQSEDNQSTVVLSAPSVFQNPGKLVSKKKTLKPTPLLLLRHEDERQKIILDKVNSIIASTSELKNECVKEDVKQESSEQKRSFLWNLCGKAEDKTAYYVEQLVDWISPSNVEVGSKLCNLSQIAGHRIFTQLPCDYTFSSADKNDYDIAIDENKESPSLIKSLRSLIGNCWMSDVDIHTASGIVIPAHKLFLALRCPALKNTFDEPTISGRHVLHWENTSFDAALHFLNFIYTGSAEWKEDIIDDLHQLAVKYEVHDLLNILDSNKETLEMLICEDTKESVEDSLESLEILPKTNCQDTRLSVEKHQSLYESNKNTYEDTEKESKNENTGYFNKDPSNKSTCTNSNSMENLVLDQNDVICIQHTEAVKETFTENILSEVYHIYEDKFTSNKHITSCTDDKVQICNLNLETHNTDTNSSNDSCRILNDSVSSESKTEFDKFQEEIINNLFSKTSHTSEVPALCATSNSSPTKTLVEKINLPYEGSVNTGILLSPKLSPEASHKSKVNDCNSPKTSPMCTVKYKCSQRNSLCLFSETENKEESTKENSLSNFRNRKLDEAVILLENETEIVETNHHSFLKKGNAGMFSPRKVSPWKVSKLKSPSFNNSDVSPRNQFLSDQNIKSNDFEQSCVDAQKNCFDSPGVSNSKKSPSSLSKSRPERSCYIKDNSFKQNLEYSLNDCAYSTSCLSSPEILVCNSDNEMEPTVENKYIPSTGYNSNKKIEVISIKKDYEMPDPVFSSNLKENSSLSIEEKSVIPDIVCCDSDDDVTVELQSTQERHNVFSKSIECNEFNSIQCDRFSDKNECSPFKNERNNLVLDVIDCCSNSGDNIDVIDKLQSPNKANETSFEDDECLEFIPLSKRIEAAKSKNNLCKAIEDPLQSLPESPWTFQTDKHCEDKSLEKSPKMVKSSACTSQQNWNTTPNRLLNKGKYKNQTTVKEPEKGRSEMTLNGLRPTFKTSDSPITPLPNYKSMVTPDLKEALKRVGVKPLPRKKAVAVLSHIYNETHPWSNGETGVTLESQSSSQKSTNLKKNLSLPKKRKQTNEMSDQLSKKTAKLQPKTITRENKAATNHPSSSSGQIHSSENKTSSPDITSSPDESNNSRENYYNLSSDFSDSSQPVSHENIKNITQYILSNDELYKKILTYSPLNLIEFQHELKENGLCISVQKLMDYLDEQCITFTCPRKEEYKKKQQARTQRFRKRMIAKISQQKS